MKIFIAPKRMEAGFTQRQLAELCNITYQSLQRYESGAVVPSVTAALRIADALNTTVEELFLLDEED